MKTIQVKIAVDVPRVPNYLTTSDNKSIPLCAIDNEGLVELADQWKQKLLARAAEQHQATYGTKRPA